MQEVQSRLYREIPIWHSLSPETPGCVDKRSAVSQAMAVLMLSGADARVLGVCPIPQKEFGNDHWYAKRLVDDHGRLPDFAEHHYQALIKAGVPFMDVWVFHERPQNRGTLASVRTKLPTPDWQQVKARSAEMARVTGTIVQRIGAATKPRMKSTVEATAIGARQLVATAGPMITAAVKSAATGTREFVGVATPVVVSAVCSTAKFTWAVAKIAWPIMAMGVITLLSSAATVAATVDPVLTIIVPSDNGGDPTWIEIARWDEEV